MADKTYLNSRDRKFYFGQRLSFNGALGSVRYYGPLEGTKGKWLGVEWDDPSRGKHNGSYQGKTLFQCLSSSRTAASFIRPSRAPDWPRTFLQAVRFKYGGQDDGKQRKKAGLTPQQIDGTSVAPIEISGKTVQEVGFDRIRRQQAALEDLKIVILEGLSVNSILSDDQLECDLEVAQQEVASCCPEIVELDLGWNLIETLQEIAAICLPLKKLRVLKANGLRLRSLALDLPDPSISPFGLVNELHLNDCFLTSAQIVEILTTLNNLFPSLKTLSLSSNDLTFVLHPDSCLPPLDSIVELILENNILESLDPLGPIFQVFPNLKNLSLQGNKISKISISASSAHHGTFPRLQSLNFSNNLIQDFDFIDRLPSIFPQLTSLRISNNPLYPLNTLQNPDVNRTSTTYSLTLARISTLTELNRTTITPRDREEGEIYFLSVSEKEIESILQQAAYAASSSNDSAILLSKIEQVKGQYGLYESLCSKYERPSVFTKYIDPADPTSLSMPNAATTALAATFAPGTLGARVLRTTFYLQSPSISPSSSSPPPPTPLTLTLLLPRSLSTYALKSHLRRHWPAAQLQPLGFRLIYESAELDPLRETTQADGGEDWARWGDWDVDSSSVNDSNPESKSGSELVTDLTSAADLADGGRKEGEVQEVQVDTGVVWKEGKKWKRREVELPNGLTDWGFWIDAELRECRVRVEKGF